jgi:hypothetical protein
MTPGVQVTARLSRSTHLFAPQLPSFAPSSNRRTQLSARSAADSVSPDVVVAELPCSVAWVLAPSSALDPTHRVHRGAARHDHPVAAAQRALGAADGCVRDGSQPSTSRRARCALRVLHYVSPRLRCDTILRGERPAPEGHFQSVGVGDKHACALDLAGKAHCWAVVEGFNATTRRLELLPSPETRFLELAVGGQHACGIKRDSHEIECWGDNRARELDAPQGRFQHVSAWRHHSCAARADGEVECWGTRPTF